MSPQEVGTEFDERKTERMFTELFWKFLDSKNRDTQSSGTDAVQESSWWILVLVPFILALLFFLFQSRQKMTISRSKLPPWKQ